MSYVNEEVVKNQQQEANQQDAEYSVQASGAGATCGEKPVLKALLPGVRLHFLRYAYFHKTDPNIDACRVHDETDDRFTLEDADASNGELNTTDNFIVVRTPLNKGYVYLFNADNPNDYHELEVDEVGNLSHVIWNGDNLKGDKVTPKDIRTKEKDFTHYKLVVNTERNVYKKYWIGYSPVQWSYDYHKKMHNASDDEKRKRQMILVECKGVKKGEEEAVDHILPYHKVEFGYYKDHGNQKIKDTLKQIHQIEKREERKGGNDTYEDMFITLHDPIGVANDIASVLIDEHQKHEAIIESIQSGESDEVIFNRKQSNQQRSDTQTGYEKQVAGLFSTALTTYQLIYNSDKMEDEYAKTTDKNKILKILAVEERKKQREKIHVIRNEFGRFLSGTYYDDYIEAYQHGGDQYIFEGNVIIGSHIVLLARHPHYVDRHLDLNKDYSGKEDEWANFYSKILKGNTNISKVLEKTVNLENLEENPIDASKGFSLTKKLISTIKNITDGYAKFVTSDTDFEVVLKYIKSFKYRGETVIQVRRAELEGAIKKGYALNINKWVDQKVLSGHKNGHKLLRLKANFADATPEEIIANKTLSVPVQGQGNKASEWIMKVLEHPRFRACVAALELVNTAMKLSKEGKDTKDKIGATGAVFSLVSASASYSEAVMLAKGVDSTASSIKYVKGFSKITGFIGNGFTVAMCVWDSIETYQARDYDASVTWAVTGALSAVLLADSIVAFAAGTTFGFLSFWPLAILFVLVLAGVALAIYFTDSPLEKFLKNSILNSEHELATEGELPYVYIQKIYKKRNEIVESDFEEWRDLHKASQVLYDLLISYRVSVDVVRYHYETKEDKSFGDHIRDAFQLWAGVKYKRVQSLKVQVRLRKYFYNISEFDFAMKLFIKGIQESSTEDIVLDSYNDCIITDENGTDILELNYIVPSEKIEQITLSSEFIFLSRTIINEKLNEYWPNQDAGDRYMAYKFGATDWLAPTGEMMMADKINNVLDEVWGSNIRIGTEEEVYNAENWKK